VTVFTASAVLALVVGPTCGGVPADSDLAPHLVATVMTESAGDQYSIGVSADISRNLPGGRVSATTAAEAIDTATALIAQGRNIDLGLSQINVRNLKRHRLTLAAAFDECANLRAGAEHLSDDYAWVLAHRRYNTGSTDHGETYAQRVIARVDVGNDLPNPPLSRPAAADEDLNDSPVGPEEENVK
jgi:type IV secretion system protein VirB1